MRSLIAVAVLLTAGCAGNVTGPTPDLLVATPPPAGTVEPATTITTFTYAPPEPEHPSLTVKWLGQGVVHVTNHRSTMVEVTVKWAAEQKQTVTKRVPPVAAGVYFVPECWYHGHNRIEVVGLRPTHNDYNPGPTACQAVHN